MNSLIRFLSSDPEWSVLVQRYRNTLWVLFLIQVLAGLLLGEWFFLFLDRSTLSPGGNPWTSPLEVVLGQLTRLELLISWSVPGVLQSLEPESFTHEYASRCADHLVWSLEVTTQQVNHLQHQLSGTAEDLDFWEPLERWNLSDLEKFRLLRWSFFSLSGGFILSRLICRRGWQIFRSHPQESHLERLFERYRKVIVLVALAEIVSLFWISEYLFLTFEQSFRSSPVDEIRTWLALVGPLGEDFSEFLRFSDPDGFYHQWVTLQGDHLVWSLEVTTQQVNHLEDQLAHFNGLIPGWSWLPRPNLYLLRRGVTLLFVGLALNFWFRPG